MSEVDSSEKVKIEGHPPSISEPYFVDFYQNTKIDLLKDQRFLDMLFGRLSDIGCCNIGPQYAYTENKTPYLCNSFKLHKSIVIGIDKQRTQFKVLSCFEAIIRESLYKSKFSYGNLVFRSLEFSQETEMVQLYIRFCLESN